MPDISLFVSDEEYAFLWELADENNVSPTTFTEQLITHKLTELWNEARYIESLQQELDVTAEFTEKSVEEALA
jgi:hypothetical protein